MTRERRGRAAVAVLALLGLAAPSLAAPIPSKAADPVRSQQADRAAVEAFLARQEVGHALAARGLSADDVQRRVAQLSPQDLSTLASHLDQIQAAGEVPKYIWILLAILIGVTIIVTIF